MRVCVCMWCIYVCACMFGTSEVIDLGNVQSDPRVLRHRFPNRTDAKGRRRTKSIRRSNTSRITQRKMDASRWLYKKCPDKQNCFFAFLRPATETLSSIAHKNGRIVACHYGDNSSDHA